MITRTFFHPPYFLEALLTDEQPTSEVFDLKPTRYCAGPLSVFAPLEYQDKPGLIL
jgi:hypothetical protein